MAVRREGLLVSTFLNSSLPDVKVEIYDDLKDMKVLRQTNDDMKVLRQTNDDMKNVKSHTVKTSKSGSSPSSMPHQDHDHHHHLDIPCRSCSPPKGCRDKQQRCCNICYIWV
jgi:hypothetical protein